MILRYTEISVAHSVAISTIADRIEFEARLGRTVDVLHLQAIAGENSIRLGCTHVGPGLIEEWRRRGLKIPATLGRVWSTPFGFCNSRDVASELVLRQILYKEKLAAARERGHDLPYLHLWE